MLILTVTIVISKAVVEEVQLWIGGRFVDCCNKNPKENHKNKNIIIGYDNTNWNV